MNRLRRFLLDSRTLALIGLTALAGGMLIGADASDRTHGAVVIAFGAALFGVLLVRSIRRLRKRRAGQALLRGVEQGAAAGKPEIDALRERLLAAIHTIKTSRLGDTSGPAALYELPWYLVIGDAAAGKSTAIVKSGLTFPFAECTDSLAQRISGTRNCDWYFTSEGILLDTAGCYAVEDENRREWLGFLSLLKKHRPKAPVNGVIIAASLAELSRGGPDAATRLAKSLRQRVQELTKRLEVFAPVYLVFTKADRVSGFVELFGETADADREKVWGATFAYDADARSDAVARFDAHFDELGEGLKELSLARLSLYRGKPVPSGVLAFPLEFNALKPALRAFVATLFEDNPYQFSPIFRGFYFTSAIQEGAAARHASEAIAATFGLSPRPSAVPVGVAEKAGMAGMAGEDGYFLKDLFSKVIFADRDLVRRFASRGKRRARALTFGGAALGLALALGGWSWSYLGNRHLIESVRADLDKAGSLQRNRVDLASRLEALEVLQDRIEQLAAWRSSRPVAVGLGLYQGEVVERKLREEYFGGVRQLMLQPVAQALERYLGDVNAQAAQLQPMPRPPDSAAPSVSASAPVTLADAARPSRFAQASPESVEDAYNALKTYLMLADKPRMESGHLTDQITRFWRDWLEQNRGTMPNEQMIRSAERLISFSMANLQDPAFPVVAGNLGLVDQTRENLRRVARGTPARERVYAEVKARAATRFAPMTVARIVGEADRRTLVGAYAVPGTFTREAWQGYVEGAFREASTRELQSVDWVLKTSASDDLTLQGSPEQIRKALTGLYKAEYVREWQRFMQGVSVDGFGDLPGAVTRMNRLGDPADSPLGNLLTVLVEQTSWDNPSLLDKRLAQGRRGVVDWFRQAVLRQVPTPLLHEPVTAAGATEVPLGPVGREFAALSRITMTRADGTSLLTGYLDLLGKLRSRFNQLRTQGDAGPASRQMMAGAMEGGASELGEALRFVDEQMLVGMPDTARATLRPLLVRPLIQSFAVVVPPTEAELNRTWAAQVFEPYRRTLADKYPFDPASRVEATPQDIAKTFGPDGAVAKFTGDALGPLVIRRGDTVTARRWADMGLRLNPAFADGFAAWVAPLEGASGGSVATAAAGVAATSQTTFQILPLNVPGLKEYTLEIDGQVLRYRNATAAWTTFVWPNPGGAPGSRVTAVTDDDRTVEFFNEPGRFSLERLFEVATKRRGVDGVSELSWSRDGQSVSVLLRVVSQPGATTVAASVGRTGLRGVRLPAQVAGADDPQETPPPAPPSTGDRLVATAAHAAASGANR